MGVIALHFCHAPMDQKQTPAPAHTQRHYTRMWVIGGRSKILPITVSSFVNDSFYCFYCFKSEVFFFLFKRFEKWSWGVTCQAKKNNFSELGAFTYFYLREQLYTFIKGMERILEWVIIREAHIIILKYCKSFWTGLLPAGLYSLTSASTCQGDLSKSTPNHTTTLLKILVLAVRWNPALQPPGRGLPYCSASCPNKHKLHVPFIHTELRQWQEELRGGGGFERH